jgi:hypothetical protein
MVSEGRVLGRAGRRWPISELLLALGSTSIAVGAIWDISWHSTIGRDSFWTPAHMAIYLGGTLGGLTGGWLAIKHTFFPGQRERTGAISILGARAPLGAWIAIWGAVAMLTSAPFDNWWHNAYGLDVKIISPPHVVLALGIFGICLGAMLLAAARQNREPDGAGGGIYVYTGGIFILIGAIFVSEYTTPNLQHAAFFYKVCAAMFPLRLVVMSRSGRTGWPGAKAALVYMFLECVMLWILPLFPAQPRLAPIFNPVTHMVPPVFPLLLFFPAMGMDLVLRRAGENLGFRKCVTYSLVLGAVFVLIFLAAQWLFSVFLISHGADDWFFAGNRFWSYGARLSDWRWTFWNTEGGPGGDAITIRAMGVSYVLAVVSALLGMLWGGWMRKVVR